MAISAPLHAARVPEDAVGHDFAAFWCWGHAFCSPKAFASWRQAPPTLRNVFAVNIWASLEVFFEAIFQRVQRVFRNEVGHVCRQRNARGVDPHTVAQVFAELSHNGFVDDVFGVWHVVSFVEAGACVSTIVCSSIERERVNHAAPGVHGHGEALSRFRHRTANPNPARVPLPPLQGNVPLAVVRNKPHLHTSVRQFWDEAPEGHVHVSGKDAAAASAAFRQAVVETLAWFAVFFGMIVVQVEDSDERLHAIEDGLVPLHLHRQDATPSAL